MESNCYLTVTLIWAVAVIIPGPNFFITAQTAIQESYKGALFTVLGIVGGTLIWAIAGCLGVTLIFQAVPMLYLYLKIIGGLYLIYLGLKLLVQRQNNTSFDKGNKPRSATGCFCQGAFTNLLNPKTAAFMTSLFAVALPSNHAFTNGGVIILLICTISAIWYTLVAILLSKENVKIFYDHYRKFLEKVGGGIFVYFGAKLAISE